MVELDIDDLANYVQERLLDKGYIVEKEALVLTFELETEYMFKNGFMEVTEVE